jgi:Zn-dependent alcohol dehydrogenase
MSPRCVLATTSLHVYRASAARVRNASRPPECRRHRGARETATPRVSQNGKPLRTFAAIGSHAEHMLLRENSLVRIEPGILLDRAAPRRATAFQSGSWPVDVCCRVGAKGA